MKSTRDKLAKRYKLRVVSFVKDVSSSIVLTISLWLCSNCHLTPLINW